MDRTVVVALAEGLHARPAALFVKEASAQPTPVTIGRPGGEPGDAVEAASILGVMTLGIGVGDEVVLATATDDDAATTSLDALVAFLEQTEVA
ncbi:HPr family phosphocarrier protein [Cellulosimicrobium terreum]|nr:HPr family phosphocarrier protein [Cellulosimicrobium terreum]